MRASIGSVVYIPAHNAEATVTRIQPSTGRPIEAKYIDDRGNVVVVDLIVTGYELVTVLKRLWNIIRVLFKWK